jgi:hypothetical protein
MYEELDNTTFVPLDCVDQCIIGKYEINKSGQIKNIKTGRILKTRIDKCFGYVVVSLKDKKLSFTYYLHVLLAKTFIKNSDPINKTVVDHINSDKSDFNLSNLEWVSQSENIKKATKKSSHSIYFVKMDKNGEEIERLERDNFSQYERHRIYDSYLNNKLYKKANWKVINIDVEKYYSFFSEDEKNSEKWIRINKTTSISSLGVILKYNTGILLLGSALGNYSTININGSPILVHRLIAEVFLLKRRLLKDEVVDHINRNGKFNAIWNLRVTDQKGNLKNPNTLKLLNKSVGKYSLDGNLLEKYESMSSAGKSMRVSVSLISMCCSEQKISAGGYLWARIDGAESEVIKHKVDLLAKKNKK